VVRVTHGTRYAAVLLAVAAAVAGCTAHNASSHTTNVHAVASAATRPSAPAPAVAMTATAVLGKLAAAGLPVSNGTTQDENTDPNKLLGRPNGYTSRASFDVPGGDSSAEAGSIDRGGVIEVFGDAAGVQRRADYIAGLLQQSPALGTEYHYANGPVLVRISGKVKPSVANQFGPVVAALKP
jgi:hypothetical protein